MVNKQAKIDRCQKLNINNITLFAFTKPKLIILMQFDLCDKVAAAYHSHYTHVVSKNKNKWKKIAIHGMYMTNRQSRARVRDKIPKNRSAETNFRRRTWVSVTNCTFSFSVVIKLINIRRLETRTHGNIKLYTQCELRTIFYVINVQIGMSTS